MTLSVTSSLASPVDSGVALLDSDADTSVSEATINETDNLSLRDEKEVRARQQVVEFVGQAEQMSVGDKSQREDTWGLKQRMGSGEIK
jgi:hypothetical protein